MKKLLILSFCLIPNLALSQGFEQSADCDVRIREKKEVAGICPDKTKLKIFDEQFNHHDKIGLDDAVFSYQIIKSQSSDDGEYEQVELFGKSNMLFLSLIYTVDYKHPGMSGYRIWLSKNQKNVENKQDTCYYTCALKLTPIKK